MDNLLIVIVGLLFVVATPIVLIVALRAPKGDPRDEALLAAIDDALLVYKDGHAGYEIDMSLMVWRPTRRLDKAMTRLGTRSRYLSQRVHGNQPAPTNQGEGS